MRGAPPSKQSGVALIIALVFMTLIVFISVTSMDSTRLEVHMAANEQASKDAMQRAQAVVDLLGDESDTFRVTTVGYLRCNSGNSDQDCDTSANLAVSNSSVAALVDSADSLSYRSEFYYETTQVPRASLANASGQAYGAAYFDLHVLYDDSDSRGGRTEVSQGIGVRIPNSSQSSGLGTTDDSQMQIPVTTGP
ncbi:hypothetical protein HBA55_11640 [Pseudomaricurvus alkylphenolicus]|uniref:pilus assembly PilX family protein n=1 Tax=Pseudomaricurvus alkylphenolicus TaxID=1306991 RepID=UPI00142133FE|nr:PilX N-terminal domain-containing pilus assembly protein [Pseudomaricurvus alkylphenolicus]NIB40243.1 hypothetical protein [Pseudomaricurvus alkylphenolicus]